MAIKAHQPLAEVSRTHATSFCTEAAPQTLSPYQGKTKKNARTATRERIEKRWCAPKNREGECSTTTGLGFGTRGTMLPYFCIPVATEVGVGEEDLTS